MLSNILNQFTHENIEDILAKVQKQQISKALKVLCYFPFGIFLSI